MARVPGERKQQILQALARMLESPPGVRITTAALAAEVGVSEAALYRHFPSKTRMFEGLVEFMETTLFSRINAIIKEEPDPVQQCYRILALLLGFTERNPGFTRILTGDALIGEPERLHQRVVQLFERIETQLRTILRDAQTRQGLNPVLSIADTVNLMLLAAEGKISQFERSNYSRLPMANWQTQWDVLTAGMFR